MFGFRNVRHDKTTPVLKILIPPVLDFFTPLPLPLLQPFNHSSTGGKKHENTDLLHKLIIQHNYQQMKKKKKERKKKKRKKKKRNQKENKP